MGKSKAKTAVDPTASILDDISDSDEKAATATALRAAKLHHDSPGKWQLCSQQPDDQQFRSWHQVKQVSVGDAMKVGVAGFMGSKAAQAALDAEDYQKDPHAENWQTCADVLKDAYERWRLRPTMDLFSDGAGSNISYGCSRFYSAYIDAFQQNWAASGRVCIANPPFTLAAETVAKAEATKATDPGFQLLLVLPKKSSMPWFKQLMSAETKTWRILQRFMTDTRLFRRPHKQYPFDRSKRHQPSLSVDVIYMWVFNDQARYKDAATYDIAEDYQRLEAAEGPRKVQRGKGGGQSNLKRKREQKAEDKQESRHGKHLDAICETCKRPIRNDHWDTHIKEHQRPKGKSKF